MDKKRWGSPRTFPAGFCLWVLNMLIYVVTLLQTKVQLMSSAFLPRMRWTLVSSRWKLFGRQMEVSHPPSLGQRLAHQCSNKMCLSQTENFPGAHSHTHVHSWEIYLVVSVRPVYPPALQKSRGLTVQFHWDPVHPPSAIWIQVINHFHVMPWHTVFQFQVFQLPLWVLLVFYFVGDYCGWSVVCTPGTRYCWSGKKVAN